MNVNEVLNQMNVIFNSKESLETKVDQISTLLNNKWPMIIHSQSTQVAENLERLGNEFTIVANSEANEEIATKTTELSQSLLLGAQQVRTPNLFPQGDGTVWTEEELRHIKLMKSDEK